MTTRRTSANIYDYPEHLNPFHEDDNHSRLRFWTVTKKKSRSNSFSFQSIKDFRGSIRLPRSRNRTDTSSSLSQLNCYGTKPKNETPSDSSQSQNKFFSTLRKLSRSFSIRNKNKSSTNSLDQTSQIENDEDEVQLRVSPPKRYAESCSESQCLSVTPLPRSRFHERVRKSENPEPERSPESETVVTTLTEDNNPFSEDDDEENNVVLRHSPTKQPITPARKKKRAPPPPMRKSSLKAKTLTDYQASQLNENKPEESTEKEILATDVDNTTEIKITSEEIQTVSADNVNIQIKHEKVVASDNEEQNKPITTEEDTEKAKNENNITNIKIPITEVVEDRKEKEEVKEDSPVKHEATIEESPSSPENNEATSKDHEKEEEKVKEDSSVKHEATIEESASSPENNEATSSVQTHSISENQDCISYHSEVSISRSRSSSVSRLELYLQEEIVEDASDLLELVNKLKMEVDKMTDDTNNNIIETEEERKSRNIQSWIKLHPPKETDSNLDDDDDVISAPMSPRLVRLRKDSDWIRQPN